jgi:hypothetical protein
VALSAATAGDAAASAAAAGDVASSAAAGDDCFCRFFVVLFLAMVNSVEAKLWWLLLLSDDVWCMVKNICSEFS